MLKHGTLDSNVIRYYRRGWPLLHWYCLNHEGSMNQENGPLVTDEPVEYEK